VRYGTTTELQDFSEVFCYGASGTGKTVNVSLLNASNNYVMMGLGSALSIAPTGLATPFQNVPDGTVDLIGVRSTVAGGGLAPNRVFVQRGLTPAAGSTVTVDFNGPSAADPATATLTINGLGADQASVSSIYRTANKTLVLYAFDAPATTASRTIAGFPPFTGSFHQIQVSAAPNLSSYDRISTVGLVFGTVAPKTVTLGPEMGAVTVAAAATSPVLRPQAVFPTAAPYHQSWNFTTSQGTGAQARTAIVQMTSGYAGTPASVTVAVPDLSAATGWLPEWGLRSGVSTSWSAFGQSTIGFGAQSQYAEGASMLLGGRLGTLAP
jgi:hypothetical protein